MTPKWSSRWLLAASAAISAAACLLAGACSPPTKKEQDTRSSQPEPSPSVALSSPSPINPWKTASEWPGPSGPLGDAQRFLLAVPAYQCADEAEDLTTHQKSHGFVRVVHNEALMTESDGTLGRNGIITDGKQEFVFFHGRYGKEPGNAAATLADQLRSSSLQCLFDGGKGQISFLGPEKVESVEAAKYAWNIQAGGNTLLTWGTEGGQVCVWIAKDNRRPLKTEWKGSRRDYGRSGAVHDWVGSRAYHYDAGVKVTLPGS